MQTQYSLTGFVLRASETYDEHAVSADYMLVTVDGRSFIFVMNFERKRKSSALKVFRVVYYYAFLMLYIACYRAQRQTNRGEMYIACTCLILSNV